jgi:ring-1,2-phenylacetyl-CoA epoxidase subunit PaaE
MVTGALDTLVHFNVSPTRMHRELFFVEDQPHERPAVGDVAAPQGGSAVTATLDGRATTTTVPVGTPILDGLQASRPDLPFACKGGVCGTCRAQLVSGQVVMRRNFALEPHEIDAGFILTCQSECLTPEVSVNYDA